MHKYHIAAKHSGKIITAVIEADDAVEAVTIMVNRHEDCNVILMSRDGARFGAALERIEGNDTAF